MKMDYMVKVDDDSAYDMVVLALKDSILVLESLGARGLGAKGDKKLIKSMKRVIKYYGTES